MSIIGFTGTRNDLTVAQENALRLELTELVLEGMTELHHGACRGADARAVAIIHAVRLSTGCDDIRIIAHLGRGAKDVVAERPDRDERAVAQSDEVLPEKTHFARNRDIVRACDVLLACPSVFPLPAKGGTVFTITAAVAAGKPVRIVWPDGIVGAVNSPEDMPCH